jgi:Rieske Fe-S protein
MSDKQLPTWKEDFPIETTADNYVSRREFTRFLVLVSGAAATGSGYFVVEKFVSNREEYPTSLVVIDTELGRGQAKLFTYPTANDPAILIRLNSGAYVAYRQRCTHLSCPVNYQPHSNQLECPCHNGVFDAGTGAVLGGPPRRPLPRITLRVDQHRIYAIGVQGS